MILLNVDDGAAEFPGGNASLEQDIELSVGSSLEFRETEVGDDKGGQTGSTPNKTTFTAEVGTGRVKHPRAN